MNTNIDEEKDKTNIKINAAKQKYMVEGKEYSPWQKPAIEARTPTEIAQDEELFFLYRYDDYESYKKFQTFGNKEKLHMQAASKMSIKALSKYVYDNVSDIKFGLCHGTRRGNEQKWFKEYVSLSQMKMIDVLGTEISDTATQFANTIEWDFHDVKDEWVRNTCFVYSNSLDHAYDPVACLKSWMSCLKEGGICIIEWSPNSVYATKIDPFSASFVNYITMARKCGCYIKNLLWYDDIIAKIREEDGEKYSSFTTTSKLYMAIAHKPPSHRHITEERADIVKRWLKYDHANSTWTCDMDVETKFESDAMRNYLTKNLIHFLPIDVVK